MYRVKAVAALMLVILLVGASWSPAAAQAQPAPISRADIEKFVAQAFAKEVTTAQVRAFYNGLDARQKTLFKEAADRRLAQVKVPPKPPTDPNTPVAPQHHGDCWEGGNTECWESSAPSSAQVFGPPGSTLSSTYYWNEFQCDGNDPDWELVLYFPFDTAGHPDWTKWDSSDPTLAVFSIQGYSFKTFGYSFGEVRLCMPDSLVYAAGGPWVVHRTTYIFR
jgi:hypothetical protein